MEKNQKITASAFLHKNGKLFVAKRANTKKFLPGKFELPGGHIEWGEDIEDGLRREFREEFGVQIKVENPFHVFSYITGNSYVAQINYFSELYDDNQKIKLNPLDHSEYAWVILEEAAKIFDKNDAEWQAVKKGFVLLNAKHAVS